MFKYKSKVGRGSSEYSSLRLIIPKEVTKFLEINQGDYVEWIVNVDENGVNVHVKKKN